MEIGTLPPRSECVKAVDKGLTTETYGKATNKGLTPAELKRKSLFAADGAIRAGRSEFTCNGNIAVLEWQVPIRKIVRGKTN